MLKMTAVFILASLALCACSPDSPPAGSPKADGAKPSATAKASPSPPSGGGAHPSAAAQEKIQTSPNRSELRALSEEATHREHDIKGVMKEFDDNLDNPQARKDAQAHLKQLLQGYKEKMSLIGKAKMKAAK